MNARTCLGVSLALAALVSSRTARAQAVPDAPLESFSLLDGTELRGYLAARESDGTLSILLLDGTRRTVTRDELYERRTQRAAPSLAPSAPWVRVTVALTPPALASAPPATPPDKPEQTPATPGSNSVLYAVASGIGALTSLAITVLGYDAWQNPGPRGSGTAGLFTGGAVTLLTTTALTVGFSLDARRRGGAAQRPATLSVAGVRVARW